jgi:serine/threonine protein kinase
MKMSDDRWLRLQSLFEQALTVEPSRREAFLAATEPDPALRAEVAQLLRADEGAQGEDVVDVVVQRAASAAGAASPASGTRIGPWRLLEELGAGGMGTVFRAERADGAYERIVAIKFLRGIPTADAAERMRRERQMLADLDHPNIAGLLDGGTTPEGQPYLVMDHVEGIEVTTYAQGRSIEERLRLIQRIARALHFAHTRLIVHRDLKPANVLVRGDGTPVLLDFGIAKLVDPEEGEAAAGRTQAWFTPGYASPEQRRGEPVSTASDVYALGQLMAEVLSGVYRPPSPGGDVVPPSARGLAGLPRRRLRELDAIVLHACAPEPRERYHSADALAEDIDRYFRHKPLRAAPARPLYLVSKFLRRNRVAVIAGCLFVLAIGAFTWRLATERDRALRAEAEAQLQSTTAESVIEYLVSLFEAASPEQAGNTPILPAELVDRGLARVDEQLADQPLQKARMLAVLGRIDTELGRSEQAVESLRAALAIERERGDTQRVAEHLVSIGVLENQNERNAEAEAVLREAVELLRGSDQTLLYVEALTGLAISTNRTGRADEARSLVSEALRTAEREAGTESAAAASVLEVMAEIDGRTGRPDLAIGAASRALAIRRVVDAGDEYSISTAIGFLANSYVQADRYAEAEPLFREMLEMRLRTLEPGSAWVITARNNLAHAIYMQGRVLEALPLMQENVDLLRAAGEDDTPSYLIAVGNIASLHELTGNLDESIRLFEEVLVIAESAPGADRDPRMYMYRQNLGRSLLLAGRLDEAHPHLAAEIPDSSEVTGFSVEAGRQALHLAEWHRRRGELAQVEPLLDDAQAIFGESLPEGHPRFAAVLRVRGSLALDQGRIDDAVAHLRAARTIVEDVLGPESHVATDTQVQLAEALLRAGEAAESRSLLAQVRERVQRLYHAKAPIHVDLRRLDQALAGA